MKNTMISTDITSKQLHQTGENREKMEEIVYKNTGKLLQCSIRSGRIDNGAEC